jgi:23S rRNA-/tRNA-specific pseudouridylate synthase
MNTPPLEPHLISEANGIFAVFKPAFVATHPSGNGQPTLVDWLDLNLPGTSPVHRLDLHTSGVVLCATDRTVRGTLGQQFSDRLIKKRYLALVHGRIRRKGIIRRPLADARRSRPLPAVTRYSLIEWIGPYSLVRVRPETGRKHQIRRHLQSIGHAIVGDERYRPKGFKPATGFPYRLWLHAADVTLPDGTQFNAPLPEALETHLTQLRAAANPANIVTDASPEEG